MDKKREGIRRIKENPQKLESLLKKKIVPVVLGPQGRLFMIDHHHTAVALLHEGIQEMYFSVVEDFSDLHETDFLMEMMKRRWIRLLDKDGEPLSWTELSKITLSSLHQNDRYRSLAAQLREEGGFKNLNIPFLEFDWADFLRSRIPPPGKKISWNKALKRAKKLARSAEAAYLLGYIDSNSD